MLKDFKAFIMRGNAVDLAIGVVVGAAFTRVVDALVKKIFTPLISLPGTVDFTKLTFKVRNSTFGYGIVLTELITFLLTAAAVFFFVVKPLNTLQERRDRGEEPGIPTIKKCPECLSEIPIAAKRCAYCTTPVGAAA